MRVKLVRGPSELRAAMDCTTVNNNTNSNQRSYLPREAFGITGEGVRDSGDCTVLSPLTTNNYKSLLEENEQLKRIVKEVMVMMLNMKIDSLHSQMRSGAHISKHTAAATTSTTFV